MGTISLEKINHLYWLGRYTERVYTTLRAFEAVFDDLIDRDAFAYDDYCRRLSIANIYSDEDQFVQSYLFHEDNPDSLYSNLLRAYDNAIVLREELSSTVLAYVQMAIDVLGAAKGSRAPLMDLQKVMDDLLAFWGSVDDFVESEVSRNLIKCGKYVERLDLYIRLDFPEEILAKECSKLKNRANRVGAICRSDCLERFVAALAEGDIQNRHPELLQKLGEVIEV